MTFLRENIFLLVFVAVVLIVGIVILVMGFSADAGVDDLIDQRVQLSGELDRVGRTKKVNDAVLKSERDRVDSVRKAARDLLDKSRDWNRRNYQVIELQYNDDDGKAHIEPAFPIDRRKYESFGLVLKFTGKYREKLLSLLGRLNATRPPTEGEITIEAGIHQRRLDFQRQTGERKPSGMEETPSRHRAPGAWMDPMGQGGWGGGGMGMPKNPTNLRRHRVLRSGIHRRRPQRLRHQALGSPTQHLGYSGHRGGYRPD
jgi:hypothetical protein